MIRRETALVKKLTIATTSLGGCFGCHMSLLDIDERIVDLADIVEFDRSPLTDIKHCSETVDIGLIEGGVCNSENVHTLREFRKSCKILVAVGAILIKRVGFSTPIGERLYDLEPISEEATRCAVEGAK